MAQPRVASIVATTMAARRASFGPSRMRPRTPTRKKRIAEPTENHPRGMPDASAVSDATASNAKRMAPHRITKRRKGSIGQSHAGTVTFPT
jgi:hypothetical protein